MLSEILATSKEKMAKAVDSAKEVTDRLVDSERWSEERADRLSSDLDGCGALVGV